MSACITDPQKPEYVELAREQERRTSKVYTQVELETAVAHEYERIVKAIRDLRLNYVPTNTVLEAIAPRKHSTRR